MKGTGGRVVNLLEQAGLLLLIFGLLPFACILGYWGGVALLGGIRWFLSDAPWWAGFILMICFGLFLLSVAHDIREQS